MEELSEGVWYFSFYSSLEENIVSYNRRESPCQEHLIWWELWGRDGKNYFYFWGRGFFLGGGGVKAYSERKLVYEVRDLWICYERERERFVNNIFTSSTLTISTKLPWMSILHSLIMYENSIFPRKKIQFLGKFSEWALSLWKCLINLILSAEIFKCLSPELLSTELC